MINKNDHKEPSFYSGLYDILIPSNHILRRIDKLVDFSFVMDEVRNKYSEDMGRLGKSPIMLFKLLLLKSMHKEAISDIDLVEQSKTDLSYKYFLGLNPEDDVINPSTLTKFRKLRLKDSGLLDLLIAKTVSIAKREGVIESKDLILDATHTIARYNEYYPLDVLRKRSEALRKSVRKLMPMLSEGTLPSQPEGRELSKEMEYTRSLLDTIDSRLKDLDYEAFGSVATGINLLEETLDDVNDHVSCSSDPDARIGHKSADMSFFGYKSHVAMTGDLIITAVSVTSGEKADGNYLGELVDKTLDNGVEVEKIIGDGAYSGRDNIEYAKKKEIELVSKLNPQVYAAGACSTLENAGFVFNKDANVMTCRAGKTSFVMKSEHKTVGNIHFFMEKTCRKCPLYDECKKTPYYSRKYGRIKIDLNPKKKKRIVDHYPEFVERQGSEEFKNIYRQRYKIEGKNADLKNNYGYGKAYSSGIQAMRIQGAFAVFAANMHRIMVLKEGKEKK